jgi:dipeptidyl aminopeptidase/acylaminoacyl peptidase
MKRPHAQFKVALCIVLIYQLCALAQRPVKRLPTPDDVSRFGSEDIWISLSPDGEELILRRSVRGKKGGSLWLMHTKGGSSKELASGEYPRFYNFIWSPDSERMALLVRKGSQEQVQVWERRSGRFRALTSFYQPIVNWEQSSSLDYKMQWVSATQLAVLLPPTVEPLPLDSSVPGFAQSAVQGWRKQQAGSEPSVSVIESGIETPMTDWPEGRLLLIDALKGAQKVLARGILSNLQVSPDKQWAACVKVTKFFRPNPASPMPMTDLSLHNRHPVVVSLQSPYRTVELTEANDVVASTGSTVMWSPDGSKLAFRNRPWDQTSSDLFVYSLTEGRLTHVTSGVSQSSDVVWVSTSQLLVRLQAQSSGTGNASQRADWHLVERDGSLRNLTAAFKDAPSRLTPLPKGSALLYLSGGHLWRFDIGGVPAVGVSTEPPLDIAAIVKTLWNEQGGAGHDEQRLIVSAREDRHTRLYLLDMVTGKAWLMEKPSEEASLVDFRASDGIAIFRFQSNGGIDQRVTLSRPLLKQHRELGRVRSVLDEIAQPEIRLIDYQGGDGQKLKAQLVLPYGYRAGRRYPLITWVYPGHIVNSVAAPTEFIYPSPLAWPALLAAHGYAVLEPSVPLQAPHAGAPNDVYRQLTQGVLPAVDKVIEMGIADPERLGVQGHSYGGYAVYGLITQTDRFKAAVASAGASDLISNYGQLAALLRYDRDAENAFFSMSWLESGVSDESAQGHLGVPPWRDPELYVRNSPLFHVEQCHTPVLIIQGDMDFVPIQQGEEFFRAMQRLGKRSRFLRYWGEGHVFSSPANQRDMMQQVLRWFDEFLKTEPASRPAAPNYNPAN